MKSIATLRLASERQRVAAAESLAAAPPETTGQAPIPDHVPLPPRHRRRRAARPSDASRIASTGRRAAASALRSLADALAPAGGPVRP